MLKCQTDWSFGDYFCLDDAAVVVVQWHSLKSRSCKSSVHHLVNDKALLKVLPCEACCAIKSMCFLCYSIMCVVSLGNVACCVRFELSTV